ncbi:ESX secretion-associated protein EspG [Nocardia sp. N2S4-5]|uniref:ESX secretion-associated protein EspG n=1 Tax=Nocardia sp. N2S4-5 TaxID=3351565 RepID=UPI0037D530F4
MSWSFTPDEFAHIWRETDLDRHPFPLRILETPRTDDEAAALRRTLEARLPLRADPDLSACLRILAQPQTRVVALGGGHGPGSEIRALGAAVYDHAVLAVQEPGGCPGFGGVVHLSIGHSAKLGARIAALLPETPPGREPARSAPTAAVRDEETVMATQPRVPASGGCCCARTRPRGTSASRRPWIGTIRPRRSTTPGSTSPTTAAT